MKLSSFSLLILLFWCSSTHLQAQDLTEDDLQFQVLVFEKPEKGKRRLINQGAMIRYKLRSAPKVWQRGQLMAIEDQHLVVDGKTVSYDDCLIIAGRVYSERGIIGGAALGAGSVGFLMGTALLGVPTLGVC